jgi:protein-disulfide isomerase
MGFLRDDRSRRRRLPSGGKPASGVVGHVVGILGTGLTSATSVAFNGVVAVSKWFRVPKSWPPCPPAREAEECGLRYPAARFRVTSLSGCWRRNDPLFRYNAPMKLSTLAALAAMLPGLAAAPDTIQGNAFGNPKAPILIEVFSDFQCPGCKRFHDEELPLIVKDYVATGKAYLVYRYFPLPQHPYGRKAAELVCACAQLGKYEPAANILFAKQSAWSLDGKLDQTLAAVLTPAEQKKVVALVKDPRVQSAIDHDVAEGRALPLAFTPTVLLTYKSRQYKLDGEGLFNYKWMKATLDDFK